MVFCIVSQVCNDAGPTDVKVSILIRSMGPISDVDMVSHIIQVFNGSMHKLQVEQFKHQV